MHIDIQTLKQRYGFLDLQIVDLFGKLRHVALPTEYVDEKVLDAGIGFDASNLMFADVTSSDLVVKPDFCTAYEDPFSDSPTISMLGNIYHFPVPNIPALFPLDPRSTIQRALEELRTHKIAETLRVLPELEFYVFNTIDYSVDPNDSYVSFLSDEKPVNQGKAYHSVKPFDTLSNVRADIVNGLKKFGIPVKYHHHEVGSPGQCEIELDFMNADQCADSILLAKYLVMNICSQKDLRATFLPKPIFSAPGSGMHMHMYLTDFSGQSIFFDENNPLRLSKTAFQFMGGILLHLGAVMAFTNPSTNSYKRLIPGYEAPLDKTFAKSNREASIRIPAYTTLEQTRFEFRTGDATANPYYAISALIMAGIDGIKKQIDPYDEKAIRNSDRIPRSLMEAFDALKKDHEFLKDVFPKTFVDTWIHYKSKEAEKAANYPNPAEFETYGCY